MGRISGPLVDRIDIHIEVPSVPFQDLASRMDGTDSAKMRQRVLDAREKQTQRFGRTKGIFTNSRMNSRQVRQYCHLDEQCTAMLKHAVYEFGLSARAHDKVLKIARTIADIAGSENIEPVHLQEAIQYRRLDRKL